MDGPRLKRLRSLALGGDEEARKLQDLLHTGGISIQGLVELLRKGRALGRDGISSSALYEANLARFMVVRHVESIPMENDADNFEWELAHPGRLLSTMIESCPELERLFLSAAARHPCISSRRWKLIVGFDEYVPGNKLKLHNQRKCMVLSYTFLELGLDCLRQDTAWFTPVVLRLSVLENAVGGWGALFRRFLRLLLFGDIGFSTSGVAMTLGGQPFLLYAELYGVLADLDGHRIAWDVKGANALRPCLLHPRVLKLHSGIADTDRSFVEISCSDISRFGKASSRDIYNDVDTLQEAYDRWQSGRMTKTRFNNLEKTCGLNWAPHGVFWDKRLRRKIDFASVITIDWVHTMLSDGVLSVEAYLVIEAAGDRASMKDLENYMKNATWCFPSFSHAKSKVLWQVFDTNRCPSNDKLKASASEMLGLYALLRHFVETRLEDARDIDLQKTSFFAACHIVDIILLAKQGRSDMSRASGMLVAALRDFLEKHKAAYGEDHIKPKFHYMFDVACQWEHQQEVFDVFVIERLHLRVKTVAELIRNPSTFERSCLSSLLNSHVKLLQNENFGDGLTGRSAKLDGTFASVADGMRIAGMQLSVGDIIFHDGAREVASYKLLSYRHPRCHHCHRR